MATSKSKALNIPCDHNGGIEYWCRECAWDAAKLLREDNERQAAELAAWAEKWTQFEVKRTRGKK